MASSQKKKCGGKNGCGKVLPLEEFHKNKKAPDGHQGMCKECKKAHDEKRYADPVTNKRIRDQKKVYQQTPAAKAKRSKSNKARRAKPRGNLEMKLRNAFKNFQNNIDSDANRELFGCTLAEFNAHIQSLWEDWMNEDNYAVNTDEYNVSWEHDHIVPFSAFKTCEELEKYQKVVCWHKNVQPLCTKKNAEKKGKFKPEDKQALIARYRQEHPDCVF